MKPSQKKIFLSHSSKDEPLVGKLTDLLTTGCGVHPGDILVTTLPGKGIPAGHNNYIEYLRKQIQQPALVILLLSENYFASQFCLCELGATWALELPNFPLIVPPIKRSEVKATLVVTQLGVIDNTDSLDDLRDSIKAHLGEEVPTSTWTAKRDVFLRELPRILKKLPRPESASRAELEAAKEQYGSALEEVEKRDEEIEELKETIGELKKCKDAAQVRSVVRKHSNTRDEFKRLCDAAHDALERVEPATRSALFCDVRGEKYSPEGNDAWKEVRDAEERQELSVEDGCELNEEHPRVHKAQRAVNDLGDFLRNLRDDDFIQEFEEEQEFPLKIGNKDFWHAYLAHI